MIRRILCLALIGAIVVGCSSSSSDVGIGDTKAKEKKIDEATKKLGADERDRGQ